MSSERLKLVKSEISDEVLVQLALELEREQEEDLQRLYSAVLSDDLKTAQKLVRELQSHAAN